MSHAALPAEITRCIDACASCHQICVDTVAYCLNVGGAHVAPDHMKPLADCEQICRTTQDFMVRASRLHNTACSACADVCDACATACETLAGDAQMDACADACRNCADACRRAAATPMVSVSRRVASRRGHRQ